MSSTTSPDDTTTERTPGEGTGPANGRRRRRMEAAIATVSAVLMGVAIASPAAADPTEGPLPVPFSIQAGVLNLLNDLKRRLGISFLFVAHDLSVIRHLSDRVAVMYKGEFVEQGDTDEVFDHPQHEYTKKLLSTIPVPDPAVERARHERAATALQNTGS